MAELKITAANFENEVLNSDKPVLLDFYGPVLTDKQRVILTEPVIPPGLTLNSTIL